MTFDRDSLEDIKIFYDGVNFEQFSSKCVGYTTNPTLLLKSNDTQYTTYESLAMALLDKADGKPVSFEVFSDEATEMIKQARMIANWGENVYVKIPIINSSGVLMDDVIRELASSNVKVNVTAVFTYKHIDAAHEALRESGVPSIISVFAGRIADCGNDPKEWVRYAVEKSRTTPNIEILWASVRQVYNVVEAINCKCNIVTIADDIFKKMHSLGKDMDTMALDTVNMFVNDANQLALAL